MTDSPDNGDRRRRGHGVKQILNCPYHTSSTGSRSEAPRIAGLPVTH
jgi:hypothetical protein